MYFEICKFSCWLTCQKLDTYFERCDCKVLNIYHTLQSHLEGVLPYSNVIETYLNANACMVHMVHTMYQLIVTKCMRSSYAWSFGNSPQKIPNFVGEEVIHGGSY